MPFGGAVEETGKGVRVIIDGVEARLGSSTFCGRPAVSASDDTESSVIFYSRGDTAVAFSIRQRLRPDAIAVVESFRARGLALHILSGDRQTTVAPVAKTLGVASWQGGLKPADKIAFIEALKSVGCNVLMVGDGLNDAPALAAAHVSLSPISAADITQAQADGVFLGERLAPVLDAVFVSRTARDEYRIEYRREA